MITQSRIMEIFDYDPLTGKFKRKTITAVNSAIGSAPGCSHNGYIRIMVDGDRYLAHRLAWLYVNGEFPTLLIDHINGNRSDNRISNLRDVGRAVNIQNQKKARKDNGSTSLLGASFHKASGKYIAQISKAGKKSHLGIFDTPELAHEAYIVAKRKMNEGNTL